MQINYLMIVNNICTIIEMLATYSIYKFVENGYKFLLVGSCDRKKKFCPFRIAVTIIEFFYPGKNKIICLNFFFNV
ncbi:hypothetical protein BpHYR1_003977 [Brachionus plicatilis]|uniref:Uncharacterized protein n=1 Tax=Brachionus plicatilis TaxID=10195 RepID=A0A3M7RXH7_BRAPC|nr:hypothetical protein BpHYR1_003977 [Brachionus plicatilis]